MHHFTSPRWIAARVLNLEGFIKRALVPQVEELAGGEIRVVRGELGHLDKPLAGNISSLHDETIARIDAATRLIWQLTEEPERPASGY
jgi:hypothetical protein